MYIREERTSEAVFRCEVKNYWHLETLGIKQLTSETISGCSIGLWIYSPPKSYSGFGL